MIQTRSEVYQNAKNAMGDWQHTDLRNILSYYLEESNQFMVKLRSFVSNRKEKPDHLVTQVVKIKTNQNKIISENEISTILKSCEKAEESCKEAYQLAIQQVDIRMENVVRELLDQADRQYMAYNHIKTLRDCNTLNLQAV